MSFLLSSFCMGSTNPQHSVNTVLKNLSEFSMQLSLSDPYRSDLEEAFVLLVVLVVMIGPTSRVFKNSRNTIGVVYFRKALGESISKMMIPVVIFKIVKSG